MKKSNKKITAGIGLALGITIFTGAVLAGYNTSNGYDVGKNAVKGLLKNENYTANLEVKLSVDGSEVSKTTVTELYDRNGDVVLNKFESSESNSSYYNGSREYKEYFQDGSCISTYNIGGGEEHTGVYKNNQYMSRGSFDAMDTVNEDDKETANKIIRFVELAADTFVGDLKNNIVYVSGDDNSSTYEMNLDAIQIPELVNAGLSAMFSSMSQNDNDEPFLVLGTDPIVKSASLKFTVNNEGRLTNGAANITMCGENHEAAVDISLVMSDYGTTKPQRVDISSLANVTVYDANENGSYFAVSDSYDEADDEEIIGEADDSTEIHIDENGNAVNEDGENVGHIEIQKDGEGVVVYNN